jgi:hypothetical protein
MSRRCVKRRKDTKMTEKFTQQTIKMLAIKDFIIGGYQRPISMISHMFSDSPNALLA